MEDKNRKKVDQLRVLNQIKIDNIRKNNFNNGTVNPDTLEKIESSNLDMSEEDSKLISYKINFLDHLDPNEDDKARAALVDQIMNEKKIDKIESILKLDKYHKDLQQQMNDSKQRHERDSQMNASEIILNKKLLEEARAYFGLNNKA